MHVKRYTRYDIQATNSCFCKECYFKTIQAIIRALNLRFACLGDKTKNSWKIIGLPQQCVAGSILVREMTGKVGIGRLLAYFLGGSNETF